MATDREPLGSALEMGDSILTTVSIWGKGFRVSQDSEEYQRLLPRDSSDLRPGLEEKIERYGEWGALLKPLYRLPEKDLLSERCFLCSASQALTISVSPTVDRQGRAAVVLVAACTDIDWSNDVDFSVAASLALSSRLAKEYGEVFSRNREQAEPQLRAGRFLKDRQFILSSHSEVEREWMDIVRAVRGWQGITGVATMRLSRLGANVLLGTKHEASLLGPEAGIAGVYSPHLKEIDALDDRLKRWIKKPDPVAPTILQNAAKSIEPTELRDSLNKIENGVSTLLEIGYELRDFLRQLLSDKRGKDRNS